MNFALGVCNAESLSPGHDDSLKRHDDLAEVLVGFHVFKRLADIVEGKHLVDRQLQFAGFHRRPDILADLVENLADLPMVRVRKVTPI
jgi:hypothetical protein